MKIDPKKVEQFADALGAFAGRARLAIIVALSGGEKTPGELSKLTGISLSGVSQQLGKLKNHRLVAFRRDAQHLYYRLRSNPLTDQILEWMEAS